MPPIDDLGLTHDRDENGEHDEAECWACLHRQVKASSCRCGECCRHLIIEVGLRDAEREPLIAKRGSPIYEHPALTASGKRELIGYLLNRRGGGGCIFLDDGTSLCRIYNTRPLLCRLFDCDGEGREQLIELGILKPRGRT